MADAGTLYQQEGGTNDLDPVEVDAAGQGPAGDDSDNWTNWKYQYGGGSWSGVYAADDGWLTESGTGDATLDIEADVEMYFTETVSNNKIYFHLGNIYTASTADRTAYVQGSFSSNNGQYIGISFTGTSKDISNFETDGSGNFTGRILGGLQSDHDTWRTQDNQMDVEILLNWGTGWQTPVNYGDGAHSTIHDTLWWLVNDGDPGTYNYQWRIRLLPEAHQPDGDYYLDPAIVASPVL
jgi:hypothetical protein